MRLRGEPFYSLKAFVDIDSVGDSSEDTISMLYNTSLAVRALNNFLRYLSTIDILLISSAR